MKSEKEIQAKLDDLVMILPVVIDSHVKSLNREIKLLKWVLDKE